MRAKVLFKFLHLFACDDILTDTWSILPIKTLERFKCLFKCTWFLLEPIIAAVLSSSQLPIKICDWLVARDAFGSICCVLIISACSCLCHQTKWTLHACERYGIALHMVVKFLFNYTFQSMTNSQNRYANSFAPSPSVSIPGIFTISSLRGIHAIRQQMQPELLFCINFLILWN